ncbi:MAG: hypothetical protein HUU55_09400 [Myxococcales bacterium]|nr:hypothetical protein [Myxococcales bacterium]
MKFHHGLSVVLCTLGIFCTDAQESKRATVPIFVDQSPLQPAVTNLGYTVQLDSARMVVRNVQFTIGGETHVAHFDGTGSKFVSSTFAYLKGIFGVALAQAHPGHYQGGEITGEMPGRFLLNWFSAASAELGSATLLEGKYLAANFTLDYGEMADGLDGEDPLVGATAVLTGTATKDGATTPFVVIVVAPENRAVVGVPCEVTVADDVAQQLKLGFSLADPLENDTLFDDVDFGAMWIDKTAPLRLADDVVDQTAKEAFFAVRNALLSHDHFFFQEESF